MLATARNEFDPAWSPVGDQFAFVTDRSGSLEIWARSRDGQWERPIVTPADFGASRTETLASLAFSPDGRTLAYQRGAGGTFEMWLSPVTGGTPVRLVTTNRAPTTGRGMTRRRGRPTANGSPTCEHDSGTPALVKTRVGTSEIVELLRAALDLFAAGLVARRQMDRVADRGRPGPGSRRRWRRRSPSRTSPILALTWRPDSRRAGGADRE